MMFCMVSFALPISQGNISRGECYGVYVIHLAAICSQQAKREKEFSFPTTPDTECHFLHPSLLLVSLRNTDCGRASQPWSSALCVQSGNRATGN